MGNEKTKEDKNNYCLICSYPCKEYTYCYICSQALDLRKVLTCKDCNDYHLPIHECRCKTKVADRNSLCVACGTQSSGFWFCKSCFKKYSNKAVVVEFTNCTKSEVKEEGYKGKYPLKNGVITKSTHEQLVGNMLIDLGVDFDYERPIQFSANVKDDLKPDFYLKEYDAYLEHLGIEDKPSYDRQTNYKFPKYKECGYTILCTKPRDLQDLRSRLLRLINHHIKGKINFLDDAGNVKQED